MSNPSPTPAAATPARPVALVTGGAVRIGRAISCALAQAGYDIAIHVRHPRPGDIEARAEVEAAGARCVVLAAELADPQAVDELVPAARAALGPVTLLVNNASEFHPDAVESLDAALWDRHFAVNLRAPAFLARALAAQLPEGVQGVVINIVDQRVLKPTPLYLSYSLTKNGLWTQTRLLAQALAPRVRVNAVAPGPTYANSRQSAEDFARQSASMPLGHGPSAREVADAVLYLAGASSVTGQMIAVDGGQHISWRTPDTEIPE
ncbi:SDR family oxidoreductase [Ancylobacter sp. A5.8]|uniref:SDR family oxidoreductase n=1 Tax=Ancylobacter gelatini TaxID=2919920 RepID=UPI001F4E618B|nr:SDR family oxidoreductase [Ancylobacter gelatini]MCJ8142352.1 SDR family oxidoreductase [Ancylobacter gelatini]